MKDAFCLIHPSLIITCPLNALGVEVISKVIGSIVVSFCLDLPCAEKLPPLTIPNPKGHHHSLLFLPRELLVPCDVCGAVDALEPSYTCFQCNMAHQRCINLPRVIKITRHSHRLHYIPYRSPLSSLCRICYKDVDVKYGKYSCNQEDCSYVVHSKCATHMKVWNMKVRSPFHTEKATTCIGVRCVRNS